MMLLAARRDEPSGAFLWPAALIVWGPGSLSASHAHHSVQLLLALEGGLRVRRQSGFQWEHCSAVFVAPDAEYEVDASGASVLIGFIDPESELAAALVQPLPSTIVPVPDAVVTQWRNRLGDPSLLDARRVDAWVRSDLLGESRPRRMHPRVRRVLRYLREEELDRDRTSLAWLARVAELSPSRLMHVFTESVGIPLRPYLLWLRVQRAAGALANGRTVTEAAHIAGFADSSHLTRTFRRTLGASPRDLVRRAASTRELRWLSPEGSQFVQDDVGRSPLR
jgi:AraC-like DNA-binding protein